MHDERELLTKETVKNLLIRNNKREVVRNMIIILLGTFMWWITYVLLGDISESFFLISLVYGLVSCAVVSVGVFYLVCALLTIKKAYRGEFSVYEDVLKSVEENKTDKITKKRLLLIILTGSYRVYNRPYHHFVFESGKEFKAPCGEFRGSRIESAARFSLPGDRFFLVSYDKKPNDIIWVYSAKIYSLKA